MIFTVTMKDPYGVSVHKHQAIKDNPFAANTINNAVKKWFEYEEYLTVEIDTVKRTCRVVRPLPDRNASAENISD